MSRLLYDSTNPYDIPTSAAMVAGYVDGIYAWTGGGWARFPNAVHVRIACFATTNDGHVLDVETGCSLPAQAPGWVVRRRAAGVDPTVYVNRSNWGLTRNAFQLRGVPEPHYWLASYDSIAEIPAGTVAKQYANSFLSGGHYDLSAVADYWPGVDRPGNTAGSEVIVPQEVPMTYGTDPSACLAIIRSQFYIAQPDIGPDEALIESWAKKITDSGNNGPDAVVQRLWSTEPTFAEYRRRLTAALNTKPSTGPVGPPGPPGPSGPPGPAITHISGTFSSTSVA